MQIAFDSVPLIADRMTGIGYCQAGQVKELIKHHPSDKFEFQYFYIRSPEVKDARLEPYMADNVSINKTIFSGFIYRALQNFIPLSYSMFFGNKSDVTHFFNYIVPPHVKTATVVTVHDMVYKAYPETMNKRTLEMLNISLERSMKRANLVVTDSEFSKSEIIKYFPATEDKVRVVPCGVDEKKFKPETDKGKIAEVKIRFNIHGDYYLYLGTLEPRKNLVRLINAYAKLKAELSEKNIKTPLLVLAGGKGWQFEEIFKLVEELNLKDNILFTQYVPDEDLAPLMCGALAFVFPSIYEGFGLPPLEAMSCGVPVVVSNAASLPEVVGDSGVIVDAFDEDSIKNGLLKIYKSPELREELSQKGLKRAKEFSWEKSAEKLYKVYLEAVKLHKHKS